MCRMGYYFLTVKRKCKYRMDVIASLATNKKYIITLISLFELRVYLKIPVTIKNTN